MKKRNIKTPVLDAYVAEQNRMTASIKFACVLVIALASFATYLFFNPLMNARDRILTNDEEVAQVDALWQQVVDAEVGSLFELRDGTLCRVRQRLTHEHPLFYSCQNSYVPQERLSEIVAVHPIGTERWKELDAVYDGDAS